MLPDEIDVRDREPLEERRGRLVGSDGNLYPADDRARVGGRIRDLEERDARRRQAGEDRPGNRGSTAVAGEEGRVHPEHTPRAEGDEAVADELRPTDHEGQLRGGLTERGEGLRTVDVSRLDEAGAEPGGNVVERALPGALRVDGAGKRYDRDHLGAARGGGLEALAADHVEAHPGDPHGFAIVGERLEG